MGSPEGGPFFMVVDWLHEVYIFIATLIGELFGSMFGGGSFFIQPALLAANIPANIAVANDITAAVFSNAAFLWFYRKQKKSIDIKQYTNIVLWTAPTLVIGAIVGGHVLKALPEGLIAGFIVVVCCLGFAHGVYKIYRPAPEQAHQAHGFIPHWRIVALLASLGLGFYDGFSGAGSGVLIIMMLSMVFGLDMKTIFSVGNIVSMISLGTAAATFLYLGLLSFDLLVLMIPACIIGGALGAKVAIAMPEKLLRVVYAGLILLLIVYLLIDMI